MYCRYRHKKISLHLHPEDAELVRSALLLDEMSPSWMIVEDPFDYPWRLYRSILKFSHIDAYYRKSIGCRYCNNLGGEREHDCKDAGGTTPRMGR